MSELLSTRDLAAGYHGHPVVQDLNLEVSPGEVVAILGPNGAGKSTTLMTIAGFLKPLKGEILIDGKVTKPPPHARARNGMALVPEDRSVFPRLSAADNLRVSDGDPAIALELFPELKPLMNRMGGQLSG